MTYFDGRTVWTSTSIAVCRQFIVWPSFFDRIWQKFHAKTIVDNTSKVSVESVLLISVILQCRANMRFSISRWIQTKALCVPACRPIVSKKLTFTSKKVAVKAEARVLCGFCRKSNVWSQSWNCVRRTAAYRNDRRCHASAAFYTCALSSLSHLDAMFV